MLSKDPILALPRGEIDEVLPGRWIEAHIPACDVVVAAGYGPPQNEPFNEFWRAGLAIIDERRTVPFLLAGDLNTGKSLEDAREPRFFCSNYFLELHSAGMSDLWRGRNPEAREYSFHHRVGGGMIGPGFRLDHMLASQSLTSRTLECYYDHQTRTSGVSDHSPIIAEFA